MIHAFLTACTETMETKEVSFKELVAYHCARQVWTKLKKLCSEYKNVTARKMMFSASSYMYIWVNDQRAKFIRLGPQTR